MDGRTSIIRKEKGKWCVRSPSNPDWNGGCYDTKAEAEERLRQVEYFKRQGMSYQEIAIGALERGVRTLAKSLEKLGLKSEIDVYRSGRGGDPLTSSGSYVELQVTGKYLNKDGEEEDAWSYVHFLAGGYGGTSRSEIGGTEGWRAMAAKGLAYLMGDLEKQGWRKDRAVKTAMALRVAARFSR